MTQVGAISRAQTLCYPLRVAAKVEDRPDDDGISVAGVKDPVGKNPAQAAVVVLVNKRMYPGRDFQAFDVRPQPERCRRV
jgi:hypothetical protein